MALECPLECRLGLISDRLRHRSGRERRFPQFVRCERHADVGQEIACRSSELLLELTGECRTRHVGQPRKLRQRPCSRRLVEHRRHRRRQAWVTRQRKQPAWRVFGLAGEPQHKREHRRRQRVQHRAAAQLIVCGLAAHQGDETRELPGRFPLSGVSAGLHDQARRQIAAQQPIVRRSDREMSAQ